MGLFDVVEKFFDSETEFNVDVVEEQKMFLLFVFLLFDFITQTFIDVTQVVVDVRITRFVFG